MPTSILDSTTVVHLSIDLLHCISEWWKEKSIIQYSWELLYQPTFSHDIVEKLHNRDPKI